MAAGAFAGIAVCGLVASPLVTEDPSNIADFLVGAYSYVSDRCDQGMRDERAHIQ